MYCGRTSGGSTRLSHGGDKDNFVKINFGFNESRAKLPHQLKNAREGCQVSISNSPFSYMLIQLMTWV